MSLGLSEGYTARLRGELEGRSFFGMTEIG